MIIGISGSYHRDTAKFAKLLAKKLEFSYKNIPLSGFFQENEDRFSFPDRVAYFYEQYHLIFDHLEEKLGSFSSSDDIVTSVTPLEILSHFMAQTAESACSVSRNSSKIRNIFDNVTMSLYARAFEMTNQHYNFQVHFQPGIQSYLSRKGRYRSFIYQEHQNAILTGLFANCMVCTIQIPRHAEDIDQQVEKIASDFLLFREKRDEQMKNISNLKNIN